MKILFIGGVADGEVYDLSDNIMSGRHSFKLSGDWPSDALRHHDYERRPFIVRRDDGPDESAEFMVLIELPKNVITVLVEAHAKVRVIS